MVARGGSVHSTTRSGTTPLDEARRSMRRGDAGDAEAVVAFLQAEAAREEAAGVARSATASAPDPVPPAYMQLALEAMGARPTFVEFARVPSAHPFDD